MVKVHTTDSSNQNKKHQNIFFHDKIRFTQDTIYISNNNIISTNSNYGRTSTGKSELHRSNLNIQAQ